MITAVIDLFATTGFGTCLILGIFVGYVIVDMIKHK